MPSLRTAFLLAATSLTAFAQDSAPQKMKPVVVKGATIGGVTAPAAPALQLNAAALETQPVATLGEVLADIPGVATSYFGPNAGRPIIRGLDGDRLKIAQNGTGTLDASSASPDHAVGIDPLAIREVQVFRGPAALLYSSSILGGVVNVVDNRIPVERLPRAFVLSGRAGSADALRSSAFLAEGSAGDFAFHLDGFTKTTENLSTPIGRIADTASDSQGAGFGVSRVGPSGYVGLSYSGLDSTYGVTEPGIEIGLRQRRWDLAGSVDAPAAALKSVSYKLGVSDYEHSEFDGGVAGSTFTNQGWDARVDFELTKIGSLEGVVGVQSGRFDFAVTGDEAFLPTTRNANDAVFGSFVQSLAPDSRLRYGFRVESAKVSADAWVHEGLVSNPGSASASFTPASLALAWVKDLSPEWATTLSLTRTERAPNYQELFADGPHVGTDAYEVGDGALGKERGIGIELELAKTRGAVSGSFSVYYNRFSSFIAQQANGQGPNLTLNGGDDHSGLARYDFVAVPADFFGAEAKVNYQLHENTTAKLGLEFFGDFVRASNRDTSEALPRISPGRLGVALHGLASGWSWRLDAAYHLAQNHLATAETPTVGYTMVGASLGHDFKLAGTAARFTLRLTNLFDVEARNASSFIKDTLPLPGRGVEAGLKLNF
ncbi:MAG: TonB-dependent receptor [Opitutales bacterium]|nr:TonB-dependent receptor [Opitutales bacterium]